MALTEAEELELLELEEAEYQANKAKAPEQQEQPNQPKTSMLESGVRGLGQGASLGLWDELAGLGEAVGQSVGVKGLGSNDWSDIGLTKPLALDENRDFGQAYTEGRDKWRGEDKQAQADNPGTFATGQVTGGVASSFIPGLNIAKGATVANAAGKAALQGGIMGFGNSEADNLKDLAVDTAKGAGTGAVIGGGTTAALNKISPAVENQVLNLAEKTQDASRALMPKVTESTRMSGAGMMKPMETVREVENIGGKIKLPPFLDEAADWAASAIPFGSKIKKGVENYGGYARPAMGAGLDKVTDMLLKTPSLRALYDKNPAAFNKFAQNIADKMNSKRESAEMKPYEPEHLIEKTQGTKYSQVLQSAQQRGPQSVGAAHFVLQSTDPEYRKIFSEDEPTDE